MDKRAGRLGIIDTKLAQGAAIFLALAIVKLVPGIMNVSIWWFMVLAAACAIKPMLTFFASGTDVRRDKDKEAGQGRS